jgi:hypothetical protein
MKCAPTDCSHIAPTWEPGRLQTVPILRPPGEPGRLRAQFIAPLHVTKGWRTRFQPPGYQMVSQPCSSGCLFYHHSFTLSPLVDTARQGHHFSSRQYLALLWRELTRFPESSLESNSSVKWLAKPDGLFRYRLSVAVIRRANRRTNKGHGLDESDTYYMRVSRTCGTAVDT